MNNLYLTFFLLFFAFSSFETKRIYYKKRPCSSSYYVKCSPDGLDNFHNDNGELIEKYYNQKANQYFGLIDSFNYQGHDYDNSKNVTYIVGCYSFHIVIEKCKDSKMKKNDSICERNVCSIFKKEK